MKRLGSSVLVAGLTAVAVSMASPAYAFDSGGFAGGLIGGMIGSAMRGGLQPRPVIVYQPRRVYRVLPRRAVAARKPAMPAAAAVVNPAADPFAATKPSGPTPIPVANKP